MLKSHWLISGLILTIMIGAETLANNSLEYPLVFEKKKPRGSYTYPLLSTLNLQLSRLGIKKFPDKVTLTSPEQAQKELDDWSQYVENDVAKALKLPNLFLTRYSMSAVTSLSSKKALCYNGSATFAVKLINDLADIGTSDQQGMIGWKYKQEKHLDDNVTSEDEKTFPKIWKNWKGFDDAILYLWHETDDGDDINVAIIHDCDHNE